MASPIGPIVVESGEPPSLGRPSEPRVKRNLFSAGPISPIIDHTESEFHRVGPSTPDPHNHLGRVKPSP